MTEQGSTGPCLLTLNAGSSSLKFAVFKKADLSLRALSGKFEGIGLSQGKLSVKSDGEAKERGVSLPNHAECVPLLFEVLKQASVMVEAIGHRVVHGGMHYRDPQAVDDAMLTELRRISPYVPEHLPAEIRLMEAFAEHYPRVPQVACFDTAFHQTLDRVAKLLPIPRRYELKGIFRYGFHGLSYAYLMQELECIAGAAASRGRIILAHLGNGASMAAVRDARCIDTTMGFTPAAGLVMSARSGDLDPGVVSYLMRTEGLTAEQFHRMVNEESGMLGLSEISSDIRELLRLEHSDARAADAIGVFCYQARKWIGAMAAALGGIDTLIFSGGIGENRSDIRARICSGLNFLGLELDASRNNAHQPVISRDGTSITVRMMRTDEELFIAQSVNRLLFSA